MAYKVIRKEMLRKRPDWLTRLHLDISPSVYDVQSTFGAAQSRLSFVKQKATEGCIVHPNSRLVMKRTDTSLEISSAKGRVYVRFYIDSRY